MRKLLNTLFVTTEDAYLSLDGENVVVSRSHQELGRFPLHALEGIITFGYAGASPALMGGCAERGVALTFCTPRGKFLARSVGMENGNVLLRRKQYRIADNLEESCLIARNMIYGKLYNARWSIERTKRDHSMRVDEKRLELASGKICALFPIVMEETSLDSLRGEEGSAAQAYFDVFDEMICGIGYRREKVYQAVEYLKAYRGVSFDSDIVDIFLEFVAVYPVGSKVLLNNGKKGTVLKQSKGFPDRPVIRLEASQGDNGSAEDRIIDLTQKTSIFVEKVLE